GRVTLDQAVFDRITALLQHPRREIRKEIARLNPKDLKDFAPAFFEKALESEDVAVRHAAVLRGFTALPVEKQITTAKRLLDEPLPGPWARIRRRELAFLSRDIRFQVTRVLTTTRDPLVRELLLELQADSDPRVRKEAQRGLAYVWGVQPKSCARDWFFKWL